MTQNGQTGNGMKRYMKKTRRQSPGDTPIYKTPAAESRQPGLPAGHPFAFRVLIGIGLPLCAALGLYAVHAGLRIPCLFYELTGLYCPGCGSGRAIRALLHGHPLRVFSCNCMLVLLGLPCTGILLHEYLRIVFLPLHLKPVFIRQRTAVWIAAVLILYWILRNIPAFSFLAPA